MSWFMWRQKKPTGATSGGGGGAISGGGGGAISGGGGGATSGGGGGATSGGGGGAISGGGGGAISGGGGGAISGGRGGATSGGRGGCFREDWRFYIVLTECVVEKPPLKTLRIRRGSLGQACQERNSLGRTLPTAKGKLSLRLLDQANVVLGLDERDVLELEEKLAELLFPITNCEERYSLLRNELRLERARHIGCGSTVRVQLRSGDDPLPGVVRFKGSLLPDRALSGIWFGVELLEEGRGQGFTEGSYQGQQLFRCEDECGVFVAVDKLELWEDELGEVEALEVEDDLPPLKINSRMVVQTREEEEEEVVEDGVDHDVELSDYEEDELGEVEAEELEMEGVDYDLPPQKINSRMVVQTREDKVEDEDEVEVEVEVLEILKKLDAEKVVLQEALKTLKAMKVDDDDDNNDNDDLPPLKINSRVVVQTREGPERGNIIFYGLLPGSEILGYYVGVDMDKPIGDWDGFVDGKLLCSFASLEHTRLMPVCDVTPGGAPHISDLRIVLLGHGGSGKSSSGNTILGRQEFDTSGRTAECVKREGDTAGRHITIVEAPGWWRNYTVDKTPEADKQEIILSVSLCSPGPHALLLFINVSESFTEAHKRSVLGHMELLGERVWSHTILLFTSGGHLGDTSIEQHIESGGDPLQWVVKKCGNRYHVIDNKKKDAGQLTELLEKIEKMVAGNTDSLFKIPRQARSKDIPPLMASSDSGFPTLDSTAEDESKRQSAPFTTTDEGKMTRAVPPSIVSKIPLVSDDAIELNHEDFIDGGAFGQVYRGSYAGTPVAVKTIHIGKYPHDSLEVIIPLCLSHPHIVRMIAVSRKEQQLHIAYEYIHGANLEQIIHTHKCPIKLDEEEKRFVALEIGMAVAYIHEKHVIHQDIKPANILISERTKTAYLTDWGLANMRDSLAQFGAAAPGQYCGPQGAGTELYMAPELFMHNSRCTSMSDMWSLGLTCLAMFTSCVPWNLHNRAALNGLIYKQEPPHALSKLQPHLKDVVTPLVKYNPESRMSAKDWMALVKSEADLLKRYGYKW